VDLKIKNTISLSSKVKSQRSKPKSKFPMAEEEEEDSPQFLEVTCKTSGKTLRFAPGTDAGFAVALINRKLKGTVPIATHIEAVKDGKEEETIAFGPNAILSNFGHNWKLQTVLSSGMSISTSFNFPLSQIF